jgi:two-component system response regulator YesN
MYRLVIVDDEFEIRNGLSQYFPWEEHGFSVVHTFSDAHSALTWIENNTLDVLLTDIRMPLMDGLELIRRVKAIHPDLICLILSGHKEFEYAREGMKLGIRHFIVKPTKYSQLSEIFSSVKEELDNRANSMLKTQRDSAESPDSSSEDTLIIQAIKRYIDANLSEASLERAAEIVRLNPNYLSTYFRANTGIMFGDYLTNCRMQEACRLLKESALRINEIADAVGYSNPTSFSRAFKLTQGMSPKEWRLRYGLPT